MNIQSFDPQHIPSIAKLYCQSLTPLQSSTALSPDLLGPRVIEQNIQQNTDRLHGYVAMEQDDLVGWFIYFKPHFPFFSRTKGIYSPDWGFGAVGDHRIHIMEALYTHASKPWMSEGRFTHTLSVDPTDHDLLQSLFALGFGQQVLDAVRDLSPIQGNPAITIRKATLEDEDLLAAMDKKIDQHLTASPCYLYCEEDDDDEPEEAWMAEPGNTAFIAYIEGKPVGAIKAHAPEADLSYLVQILEKDTLAVCGMQVDPKYRGQGIAAALLNAVIDDAKATGKARLSVDFETANVAGRRFWLRHFDPVRICVVRRLDDRFFDLEQDL